MKILVLGGTGTMGFHLVKLLSDQGNRVTVTSRTKSGYAGNIEYATGNAKDEKFIKDQLSQHWDVIIDFMVYSTPSFQARYEQFLNATGHYIFLSSSRVYANSDQHLTETSPRLLDVTDDQDYLATDEYALAKAKQENFLFNSRQKNWSIIRPYITYGNERLQLGVMEKEDWLYRSLRGKTIVDSKDIQAKLTTMTFGEDVARGIAAILGKTAAHGEAFHITSGITIRWNEVLNIYMSVLDTNLSYRPKVVLQDLDKFTQWRSGKYQITYDRLYDRKFDNSKINRYIDTSTFTCPRSGLTQCLKHFIASDTPNFKALNWKAEAIKDRMLGENMPLSEIPHLKQKLKYFLFRHLSFA